MTSERAEEEAKDAKSRRLEERVHAHNAEEHATCVSRAWVEELTAEPNSLSSGIEQIKVLHDTFACCIRVVEVDAKICEIELGAVVQVVQLVKNLVAAGNYRASMVDIYAFETLEKMSELQLHGEEMTQSVGC